MSAALSNNINSLASGSDWNLQEIETFLQTASIPLRLAAIGRDDFPLVCSLWFIYCDGALWCASHENSHIVSVLKDNNKCAFEIAGNDVPYSGVRGKGIVDLYKENAGDLLAQLIHRYLGNADSPLAKWLLSRKDNEYILKININRLSAWDYSNRM